MGDWQHIYNRVSMAERLLEYKRSVKIMRALCAKGSAGRLDMERYCIRYTKAHKTGRGLRKRE